jgi:glycerol-3-phosphate dehydrogenase subunit C
MDTSNPAKDKTPQRIIRDIVDLCGDCDTCRPILDRDCLFFPELYRLWDREMESRVPITEEELRSLMELCTLCGLCPCPNIPADLMEAKSRCFDRNGLPLTTRLLNDVPAMARLCSSFPWLVDALCTSRRIAPLLRRAAGIHPARRLPSFAKRNFFQWAKTNGLTTRREGGRTVAYFAGCSAGYLFPKIGRATVEVLERNGVAVYVPPQQCCGMPHYLEGDRRATLDRTNFNIRSLLQALEVGEDLITSCPSCGYYMMVLLKHKSYYSESYQKSVNAGEDELKVPHTAGEPNKYMILKKSIYGERLKDDGYFSSIDPMARIRLAENIRDAGQYLARLHAQGELDTGFMPIPDRMVYFAPCHQREQRMGLPYLEILRLIPELVIERVGGDLDCCGMGGNFGFKRDFHEKSLAVGRPVMEKIREQAPRAIVTDCMSCSLQFSHELPYPVFHPLEILARAYGLGA